ncbi:MAG: tetratricopeptide repeat protein [Balneolia bacterium]|nr:tetratricopeptide repeat protein [Balneolia bacterium]
MSKRLSKDELESDALVTGYVRATTFYRENKGAIYGGLIAFIVVVGGIFWYITNSAAQETNARESIAFAEQQFLMGNFETALFGSDEELEPGLVEIANRFPRTTAGNLAFYYAAVSHTELGDYESALDMIKEFSTPSGVLGVAPISLHGMILMQLERYSDAARMFERAAEWDENNSTTPFNLLQAAEAAYAAGDYNRAQQFATRIKREFPNSQQATQAIRLEGLLSARQ